jgi:hypothetical protein
MKPLWRTRADGTPRYGNGVVPKSAAHRAKRTNGKTPFDKRSSAARRLDDLMRDYLAGIEPTEAELGLARSAALAAVRIERLEVREMQGLDIDDERLVRLMGAHSRALVALRGLKAKAQPRPGALSASDALARHLAAIVAARPARKAEALEAEEPSKPEH